MPRLGRFYWLIKLLHNFVQSVLHDLFVLFCDSGLSIEFVSVVIVYSTFSISCSKVSV